MKKNKAKVKKMIMNFRKGFHPTEETIIHTLEMAKKGTPKT